MLTDLQVCHYIVSMGLSFAVAVYIAFRAGRRLRNWSPKLSDFAFDSLKELISNRLEELLGAQGVQLPAQVSIQDVAAHLHQDLEDLNLLQTIYNSLLEQALQSPYYMEAVAFLVQLGGV